MTHMLVLSGKFDQDQASRCYQRDFRRDPKAHQGKLTPAYTEEPTQDGEREVTLRRTGGQQIEMLAYHIPAASHPGIAFVAIQVLVDFMGDRTSGCLSQALVETGRKPFPLLPTCNMLHDPGYLLFEATVNKDGSLDDVEKRPCSGNQRCRNGAALQKTKSIPRPAPVF